MARFVANKNLNKLETSREAWAYKEIISMKLYSKREFAIHLIAFLSTSKINPSEK